MPLSTVKDRMFPAKDLRALLCHRETIDRGRLIGQSPSGKECDDWDGRGGRLRLPAWSGVLIDFTRKKWGRILSQKTI